MAVDLQFYDDTLTLLSAALPTTNGAKGTASAATTLNIINGKDVGTADTATGYALRALSRATSGDRYVTEGHTAVDSLWTEARITDGYNLTVTAGPWTPLGVGGVLLLPTMTSNQGVEIEIRANAPLSTVSDAYEVGLVVEQVGSYAQPGNSLAVGSGVTLGIGDATATYVVWSSGDVVQNPAGADDQVQVPQIAGIAGGVSRGSVEQLVQLDGNDAAAAALASGEAYWAGLTYAADGTVGVTKGNKGTAPLDSSTRPATPAGEPILAWVERPFSGTITDSEITSVMEEGPYAFSSSALVGKVNAGSGIVGERRVSEEVEQPFTLAASDVSIAWLRRDGNPEATVDGNPPSTSPTATPLWEVTTDGSGVTAFTDLRRWVGFEEEVLELPFSGTLAVDDYSYGAIPPGRWNLLAYRGVTATLSDGGSGASAGQTVFDFEYWNGSAWTTVFTSQTSSVPDNGPAIAYDSTALTSGEALPEVTELAGPLPVRGRVAEIPTGGAPAAGALRVTLVR